MISKKVHTTVLDVSVFFNLDVVEKVTRQGNDG